MTAFSNMLPEYIRKIQPYKPIKPVDEVERELGIDIDRLAANENPMGPSPKALDAMRLHMSEAHRYPDDTGLALRLRLAEHFGVSMESIIVSSGSSDILALTYHSTLTREAEVLTSEGSFIVYYQLAESMGVPIVSTPLKDFGFDLQAMAERVNSKTRLIMISNPNNPTGSMVRRRELETFFKRVPDHVLVVMDEAYFEYVDDGEYPDTLAYLREGRQVLIARTFSKAYGLAGLRIGYAIGSPEVIEALYKVRMSFNIAGIAQTAALAAWDDHEHVKKSVNNNRTEMQFLSCELSKRGLKHPRSFANFILIDLGKPALEVYADLLKHGVAVRPMGAWGFPTMIRATVGTRNQNIRLLNAIDRMES